MLLMYYREYRSFAHIGANFDMSEAQGWRIITGLEERLIKSELFHLERKQLLRSETHWQMVVVDVGEHPVERPKKAALLLLRQEEAPHAQEPGADAGRQRTHPQCAHRQGQAA